MTPKTVAIGVALVLVGCAPPAYKSEVVSGNADTVSVKAGHYSNPGPQATEHCAKHGKSAVLENATPPYFVFKCQ